MSPQRVFALPRQQSLLLPAVINPFVQGTKLSKATIIKVSKCHHHVERNISPAMFSLYFISREITFTHTHARTRRDP